MSLFSCERRQCDWATPVLQHLSLFGALITTFPCLCWSYKTTGAVYWLFTSSHHKNCGAFVTWRKNSVHDCCLWDSQEVQVPSAPVQMIQEPTLIKRWIQMTDCSPAADQTSCPRYLHSLDLSWETQQQTLHLHQSSTVYHLHLFLC